MAFTDCFSRHVDPRQPNEGRFVGRTFVEARFTTLAVAPTHCRWKVCALHIRSGQGRNKIHGRSPAQRIAFKHEILQAAMGLAFADPSAVGVVLGDLSLTQAALEEAAVTFRATHVHDIQVAGGGLIGLIQFPTTHSKLVPPRPARRPVFQKLAPNRVFQKLHHFHS